ncbi:spidroin-1-like [Iris pallida]|uniref:Spidroin-1-like n=1 Tax=Iris pallida TaxID=29817 RepID=A0AAX6H1C3_IRIPA|nr:spidroin-1-like [Iris pallida]
MREKGIIRQSFTNVGSWTPGWRCPREDASPALVVDSGGGESLRSPEGRRRMGSGLESRISVEAQRSARYGERLGSGVSGSSRGGWLRPRCWRSPAVGTDWSTVEAGGARSTGSQRWSRPRPKLGLGFIIVIPSCCSIGSCLDVGHVIPLFRFCIRCLIQILGCALM